MSVVELNLFSTLLKTQLGDYQTMVDRLEQMRCQQLSPKSPEHADEFARVKAIYDQSLSELLTLGRQILSLRDTIVTDRSEYTIENLSAVATLGQSIQKIISQFKAQVEVFVPRESALLDYIHPATHILILEESKSPDSTGTEHRS